MWPSRVEVALADHLRQKVSRLGVAGTGRKGHALIGTYYQHLLRPALILEQLFRYRLHSTVLPEKKHSCKGITGVAEGKCVRVRESGWVVVRGLKWKNQHKGECGPRDYRRHSPGLGFWPDRTGPGF